MCPGRRSGERPERDQVVDVQICRELKGFELVKMRVKFKESLYILMKMKKTVAVVLALVLVFGLALSACGSSTSVF